MTIEIGSFVMGIVVTIILLLLIISTSLWMAANKRIDALEDRSDKDEDESWKKH